jgi:hypothetical protein
MSWSKGAVVIVKRGDQEWGDAIEDALDVKRASNKELEELRKENEVLTAKLNEQEKRTNGIFEKIKYAFSSTN